jgi:molybdenum cofactor synthesis domain-containing protein
MDGYAVRAVDSAGAPRTLPAGTAIYAERGRAAHVPGSATPIATGGSLPEGADAVIPIEETRPSSDGAEITLLRAVAPGEHVFPPGDDARAGDLLAPAGTLLTPHVLGLLAAAGVTRVAVHRLPRAAIVTTGSELVPLEATPAPGQIRDSNGVVIAAALREFGIASLALTSVDDDRDVLRTALDRVLAESDVVVTSGGASAGERDFVKAVAEELGVTFAFTSVALRPARPAGFGRRGGTILAVLPGNPASAFVALHEFVRPAVAALGGRDGRMARVPALLDGRLHARPGRAYAAYTRVSFSNGRYVATPLENQCSALTRLAADADGFAIVPAGGDDLVEGDTVAVDIVSWERIHRTHAPGRAAR